MLIGSGASITKRLTRMNVLVSGAALLMACAAFVTYDWITSREAMVHNLSIQAQIAGSNSVSALLFNDPQSAENTLSALKAAPNIVSARIYTAEGLAFASYSPDGSREALPLSTGKAFLVIGRQEIEKTIIRKWILVAASPALTALVTVQVPEPAKANYPDTAVRTALATLAIRAVVPVDEQLGLLPFKLAELAGFGIGGIVPGRAVMLSDAPAGAPGPVGSGIESHIFIAIAPGGPGQTGEREAFARDVFATVPNLKEVRIVTSEPLRIGGQPGHQILANARDPGGSTTLTVVQWLRFGGSAYLQMIGTARSDAWKDAYPRFRAVRDGIEPR